MIGLLLARPRERAGSPHAGMSIVARALSRLRVGFTEIHDEISSERTFLFSTPRESRKPRGRTSHTSQQATTKIFLYSAGFPL